MLHHSQEMWMLEDIDRLLAKIGDQKELMEWHYIIALKMDWISCYGQRDLNRSIIIGNYGKTFIKIWNTWT